MILELGKILRQVDADRARHASDELATAQVSKENQTHYNPLSMLPTKRTLYDKEPAPARCYQLDVHAQTILAFYLDKKYQTCLE